MADYTAYDECLSAYSTELGTNSVGGSARSQPVRLHRHRRGPRGGHDLLRVLAPPVVLVRSLRRGPEVRRDRHHRGRDDDARADAATSISRRAGAPPPRRAGGGRRGPRSALAVGSVRLNAHERAELRAKHKSSSPASGRPRPVATWRRVHDEAATLRQSPGESCLLRPPTAPACRTKADKFCVSTEESRCIAAARENCSRRPIREGYPRQREGTRARPRARISPRDAAPRGDYLPRLAIAELRPLGLARRRAAQRSGSTRRAPRPSRARTCRCARSARDACPRRCGASPHPALRDMTTTRGKRALHRKIPVRPLSAVPSWTFPLCAKRGHIAKDSTPDQDSSQQYKHTTTQPVSLNFDRGDYLPDKLSCPSFFLAGALAKDATARRRLAPCTRPPEPRLG